MAKIKLKTADDIWAYYCTVGNYDKTELEDEDVRAWITPIMSLYSEEDIAYVVNEGRKATASVLFDKEYFDVVLKSKRLEEQLEDAKHIDRKVNGSLDILATAMLETLKQTSGGELMKWAKEEIFKEFGPVTKQVRWVKPDGKKLEGVVHKAFEPVSELLSIGENVMLMGPAGTGKSVLARQVAESMGLHYYEINSPQQPYEFEGFTDANGKFVDTPFTLFAKDKEPSLLNIEEIDNMNPAVGVKINNALSSKSYAFSDGTIVDFGNNHYFIASANTWGTGATADYVGRNQLDAATLNRWNPVVVDYDPTIEMNCCPDNELLEFIRDFRKQLNNRGIRHIISYRNMTACFNWKDKYNGRNIEEIIKTTLVRNLEPNDLSMIAYDLRDCDYAKIIKRLANV